MYIKAIEKAVTEEEQLAQLTTDTEWGIITTNWARSFKELVLLAFQKTPQRRITERVTYIEGLNKLLCEINEDISSAQILHNTDIRIVIIQITILTLDEQTLCRIVSSFNPSLKNSIITIQYI